jgi:hypothetical protein
LRACHAQTHVTLYRSLNFPESIAIKYRDPSHICRAEIENPSAGGCAKTEVKAKIGNERAATGVYVNTPLEQESIKPLDSLSSNMRPSRKLVERCAR